MMMIKAFFYVVFPWVALAILAWAGEKLFRKLRKRNATN
ncbi:hypothetical protein GALL_506640 [mine drainage metagenome]|uniref:Uncharacterized protein n=1 Tax=mine drainage metagenome TaxID=410659 RepID=A0A1J5PR47_9ZZZZ